jgi:hypothetical protein
MKPELQLLIIDSDSDRGRALERAIGARRGEKRDFRVYINFVDGKGCNPPLEPEAQIAVLMMHWSDRGVLEEREFLALGENAALRITYSGGGLGPTDSIPLTWFWIPRALVSAGSISPQEWDDLCAWLLDAEYTGETVPLVFRKYTPVDLITLDILCQGYLFCHGVLEEARTSRTASHWPACDELTRQATERAQWWLDGLGAESFDALEARLRAASMSEANVNEVLRCLRALQSPGPAGQGAAQLLRQIINRWIC